MVNLELLKSNIFVIVFSTLFIISAIINFFKRKKSNALKLDGIKPLAEHLSDIKREKIDEQLRSSKEQLAICIYETESLLITKLKIEINSLPYYIMRECLSAVSENFMVQMKELIYCNNIAKRDGDEWTNYKKVKAEYILMTNTDVFRAKWNEKLTGVTNEAGSKIVREEFVKIFYKHFMTLLDVIRQVSVHYDKEISKKERLLEEIIK